MEGETLRLKRRNLCYILFNVSKPLSYKAVKHGISDVNILLSIGFYPEESSDIISFVI
jgi:hypothetical protein